MSRFISLMAFFAYCAVAEAGLNSCEWLKWNKPGHLYHRLVEINPAAVALIPARRYSELSVSYISRGQSRLYNSFEGNSGYEFNGFATGLARGEMGSAMGVASFNRGMDRNTRWSNVLDNERVGPYILGDTTGGTRFNERYLIGGVLSRELNNLSLGIGGKYRAEGSYRTRDPRARATVSEFDLRAGAFSRIGNYLAGAAISVNYYLQFVNVRNFQDDRDDMFYFQQGVGLYHRQLSASGSNVSLNYSGSGHGFSLFALPVSGYNGIVKTLAYKREVTNANFGETTPGFYEISSVSAFGGFRWVNAPGITLLGLRVKNRTGIGTERVYETVIVDERTRITASRLLVQSAKFRNSHLDAAIEFSWHAERESTLVSRGIYFGVKRDNATYRTTRYQKLMESINGGFWLGHYISRERFSAGLNLSGSIQSSLRDNFVLPIHSPVTIGHVLPDLEFATAQILKSGVELVYSRAIQSAGSVVTLNLAWDLAIIGNEPVNHLKIKLAYNL